MSVNPKPQSLTPFAFGAPGITRAPGAGAGARRTCADGVSPAAACGATARPTHRGIHDAQIDVHTIVTRGIKAYKFSTWSRTA